VSQARGVVALLALLAAAVAACGPPSSVTWRNITFDLPEGWHVVQQDGVRRVLANADADTLEATGALGADDLASGGPADAAAAEGEAAPVVAMWFSYEPDTRPDDWRAFVAEQGATSETDDLIRLEGDVPASRLIYTRDVGGTTTREMVLVIASRSVVVFAQPVTAPGEARPRSSSTTSRCSWRSCARRASERRSRARSSRPCGGRGGTVPHRGGRPARRGREVEPPEHAREPVEVARGRSQEAATGRASAGGGADGRPSHT